MTEPLSPYLPGTQIQFAWAKEKVDWLLANAIPNGKCLECHLRPSIGRSGHERHYVSFGRAYKLRASRLVFVVSKGLIADGLWVLHECDNPKCINPEHLFLGTAQDNTNDMVNKGRDKLVQPRTDHVHREDILRLHREGLSRLEIANKLFISPSTVWNYISPRGPYYVE